MPPIGIIPALLLLQQDSGDTRYSTGWWIFMGCFAAYLIVVWRFGAGKTPKPPEDQLPPLSDNYGNASFAPQQTAMPAGTSDFGGVFLGKSSAPQWDNQPLENNPGIPVSSTPKKHTLIIAQTQTGKGTRVIIPTLLKNQHSSFFVIDPKGENAAVTARARSATNHVHVINPWGVYEDTFAALGFSPATYNPLDMLDRDDRNAVSIAQQISKIICPAEKKGEGTYWTATPERLLTAVLLWLTYDAGEAKNKTLARAREITSMTRKEFTDQYLIKMAACKAFSGAIRDNAAGFIDLANDTYSGLISNLGTFTNFLNDPQVKAATATSSFSMNDLTGAGRDRPTTVYLVTADTGTSPTWLRLMIWAATYAFKRKPKGARLRCNFVLDEFANLGYLDEIRKDISLVAGPGIDYTLIIQGLDQLKDVYGDARGTILSNCAYKWFCNVDDLDSCKYVSEFLGKTTRRSVTTGKTEGQTLGPHGHEQEGKSTTYGEVQRDLLQPSEIKNLGRDVAILFAPGSLPQYLRPVDYWDLARAFGMFQTSCPKLFWDPPLEWDPNPNSAIHESGKKPFDYMLYSDLNPERKPWMKPPWEEPKEKPAAPPAPPPSTYPPDKRPPIDHMLYSPLNPNRIPWMKPPWEQPEEKPATPPASETPAVQPGSRYDPTYYSPEKIAEREAAKKQPPPPVTVEPDNGSQAGEKKTPPPARKKPPDGELDIDTGKFVPYRKKPKGGDT